MNKEVRLNNFEFSIIMPIDLNRRAIDILKKIKDIIKQLPENIELVIGHNDKNTFHDFLLKNISQKSNIKLVSVSIENNITNNSMLRNIAVKESSSEIIFLMDVDIWFDIKLYSDCAKLVKEKEKPFVMLPCIYLTQKGSKIIKKMQREDMFEKFISFRRDIFQHIANPSSVIFLNKNDYFEVGTFDEKFIGHGYEDFDFMIRLSLHYNLIKHHSDFLIDKSYRSSILSEGFRKYLGAISLPYFFEKMVAFHLHHKKDSKEKYYEKRKDNSKYFMEKTSTIINDLELIEEKNFNLFDLYKELCKSYKINIDEFGVLLDTREGHKDRTDSLKKKIKYILRGY